MYGKKVIDLTFVERIGYETIAIKRAKLPCVMTKPTSSAIYSIPTAAKVRFPYRKFLMSEVSKRQQMLCKISGGKYGEVMVGEQEGSLLM